MRILLLSTIITSLAISLADPADAAYHEDADPPSPTSTRHTVVATTPSTNRRKSRRSKIRGLQTPQLSPRRNSNASTGGTKCESKMAGVRGGRAGQAKVACSEALLVSSQIPQNDLCVGATDISSETGSIEGSTAFATSESIEAICPQLVTVDSPGVWYRTQGTGGLMAATTCGATTDFDTKLSVFEGKSCMDLHCVSANDDTLHGACTFSATADWQSEVGMLYYILVHGFDGTTGNFELAISETNNNDICAWATPVVPDGSFTKGSTTAAMLDTTISTCDGVDVTSPGVWYQFMGTGDMLSINTCFQTNFDAKISVFEGSCDQLVCVGANEEYCGSVSVDSQEGQTYYVLVHGIEEETGFFTLNIATEETESANFCVFARPLSPGDRVIGNTEFAEADELLKCDPSAETNTSPTLWYSVIGTGDTLFVSTCDPETTLDTQVTLFSGDCRGLFCEEGLSNAIPTGACGADSEIMWQSRPFEQYYIMVSGVGGAAGTFSLLFGDLGDAPTFGSCMDAAGPLPLDDTMQIVVSDGASIDQGYASCASFTGTSSSTTGVWLQTVGHGGIVTASVCENNPAGASLMVFQGEVCQSLSCIQPPSGDCSNVWEAVDGETYYIYVEATSPGSYELTTTSEFQVDNDICPEAFSLIPFEGSQVSLTSLELGTTIGAEVDNDIFIKCGTDITAGGVWYTVDAIKDGLMSVIICADYDTKVSLFSGTCEDLECIGGNDDLPPDIIPEACTNPSGYTWNGFIGETYSILVHGSLEATGRFGIIVIS